ncbi:YciI family protein [Flavobacterium amniphilum]|uniref:YciI family protein n=1 Tax=Flavobacterium amniphilum TaxID=1834035 RepID=UPI00202A3D9F|nr:YciI family protein [Flavobacterium amniphilum]MCL9807030.1 YciI family protein [Flavobacterium amniphilum]
MFIIALTYCKPIEEVEKNLQEHIRFLDKYYAQEKFILSGRKNPRTGGVILAVNTTKEELAKIIQEDPFHQHGIARYEITEFIPTRGDVKLSDFIES